MAGRCYNDGCDGRVGVGWGTGICEYCDQCVDCLNYIGAQGHEPYCERVEDCTACGLNRSICMDTDCPGDQGPRAGGPMKMTLPPEIVARWRRNLTPRDAKESAPEPWRMGTREARALLRNAGHDREVGE